MPSLYSWAMLNLFIKKLYVAAAVRHYFGNSCGKSGMLNYMATASLCLILASCAVTTDPIASDSSNESGTVTDQQQQDAARNPFDSEPEEIIYGHFDQDTLARVILAEMAGQRGLNDKALDDYLSLARDTQDLGLIRRASRIATFMRDPQAASEMSRLWLEQEPDSAEAYQTLALQMLAMSRYGDAIEAMENLLIIGRPLDFRLITNRLENDDDAPLYRLGLIADIRELSQRHPENRSLRLALAHLHEQNDQPEIALELINQLAVELDYPADVSLLQADLLNSTGNNQEALRVLRNAVSRHPDNEDLRFRLGRALVANEDFEAASRQFAAIVELSPENYDMVYSLALINMEMNHLREAQTHLETLVKANHRPDDSHYYLGFIHSQYSENEEAIRHYQQVDGGNNFLQAQGDLAELLIRDDRYPEARQRLQRLRYTTPEYNLPLISLEAGVLIESEMTEEAYRLLNSSLIAYPDNLQLLYQRSVLSTNVNDLTLMEQDLRRMIELNPDDATAYNSLGYILADRTDRIDEAYELILVASELNPGDPAIMDSLGWVQYRLGMLEEARSNLEKAYSDFPDHEVAAHLGEVMWVMGDRREARRMWQNALEVQPDSQYVLDAMERLLPEPGR